MPLKSKKPNSTFLIDDSPEKYFRLAIQSQIILYSTTFWLVNQLKSLVCIWQEYPIHVSDFY